MEERTQIERPTQRFEHRTRGRNFRTRCHRIHQRLVAPTDGSADN